MLKERPNVVDKDLTGRHLVYNGIISVSCSGRRWKKTINDAAPLRNLHFDYG